MQRKKTKSSQLKLITFREAIRVDERRNVISRPGNQFSSSSKNLPRDRFTFKRFIYYTDRGEFMNEIALIHKIPAWLERAIEKSSFSVLIRQPCKIINFPSRIAVWLALNYSSNRSHTVKLKRYRFLMFNAWWWFMRKKLFCRQKAACHASNDRRWKQTITNGSTTYPVSVSESAEKALREHESERICILWNSTQRHRNADAWHFCARLDVAITSSAEYPVLARSCFRFFRRSLVCCCCDGLRSFS